MIYVRRLYILLVLACVGSLASIAIAAAGGVNQGSQGGDFKTWFFGETRNDAVSANEYAEEGIP